MFIFLKLKASSVIFATVILLITSISFSVIALSSSATDSKSKKEQKEEARVCKTPACLEISEIMLGKMDRKKDPCQDFNQFACGNYTGEEDEAKKSSVKIQEQIADLLGTPIDKNYDHRVLKIIKGMYQSCVTHSSDIEDLKKLINRIGGWSLLDPNWKEQSFSLETFYTKSLEMGYFPTSLFSIDIMPNELNPSQYMIRIRERNSENNIVKVMTGFSPDYYTFTHSYISKIIQKFNFDPTKAAADFAEYQKIKQSLINIYQTTDEPSKIFTVRKLTKDGHIPWKTILNTVFHPISIRDDEKIFFSNGDWELLLAELVRTTPKRNLVSYLMWSLVIKTAYEADSEIFNALLPRKKVEEYCSSKIMERFRKAVDYEYVTRYLTQEVKQEVKDYAYSVNRILRKNINSDKILKNETKKRFTNKIHRYLDIKVINDDTIEKLQQVEEYYANLNIRPELYFSSLLNLTKFTIKKASAILRESTNTTRTFQTTTVSSNYDLLQNALYFGAVYLTGFFAPKCKPEYLVYSTLGFALGHDMHHALDDTGNDYDEHGNYNWEWMNHEDQKNFQTRLKCLVKQYSNFINEETGSRVEGYLTLNENYADNGGINVAYKAWKRMRKLNFIEDEVLPGFEEYSVEQIFWISFASMICYKPSKETVLALEKSYEHTHAQGRFRINGVVMNSEDFSKDFKCQPNTPMNPVKKCKVWI